MAFQVAFRRAVCGSNGPPDGSEARRGPIRPPDQTLPHPTPFEVPRPDMTLDLTSDGNPHGAAENPHGAKASVAAGAEAASKPDVIDLPKLAPIACPCGTARRGFADRDDFPATVHLTEIDEDARPHFHRRQTEVYVVLECDAGATIELDGQSRAVQPLSAILIPPGVVHRAVGKMKVLIYCTPKFDPSDEFFPSSDEPT